MKALSKGLTENQEKLLDIILKEEDERFDKVQNILIDSAEASNRSHNNIKLFKHQVTPVLMMQVSKRVLNGFSPGIGKTYSSCGAYAMYRLKCLKEGKVPGKVLCVTEGSHILGFRNDWNSGGVKLLPVYDGSLKIERALRKAEEEGFDYDGIVTTWDSLKTNGFLLYYMQHCDEYSYAIFDETNALMNRKNMVSKVVDKIINKYNGGIEYVMFLNGTSFNKNIYDIYNQMNILVPRLIPSKTWIDNRYVVKEQKEIWTKRGGSKVLNKYQDIVDYKNQKEFHSQLRYYYIVKNKSDVRDSIPQHVYKFHGIDMSPTVKKILKDKGLTKDINSPKTTFNIDLTRQKFPKYDYLLNRFKETIEDRPLIYVYHKEAQRTLCEDLRKEGYRVEVLNGDVSSDDKNSIIERFNNKELDTLIFNIERAINLPTSDRIIFYEIPTSPPSTNQIKARIDRNNYEDVKFYDFLCYLDTQEMLNIVQLSYFREHHGKLLSGQGDDKVYGQLITQLEEIYDKDRLDLVKERVDKMYDNNDTWDTTNDDIIDLLNL